MRHTGRNAAKYLEEFVEQVCLLKKNRRKRFPLFSKKCSVGSTCEIVLKTGRNAVTFFKKKFFGGSTSEIFVLKTTGGNAVHFSPKSVQSIRLVRLC